WVCTRIHLHVHLPAIYAYIYTYTNSASSVANRDSHSDGYSEGNAHSETRRNTERASYPAAASGRGARIIRSRSPRRPGFGVAPKRTSWYLAIDFENYRRSPRWR